MMFFLTRLVWGWTSPTGAPPTGGGALYYSGGNVGIGTTGPGSKLDVQDINNWSNGSSLNVTRSQNANSANGKAITASITDYGTPNLQTLTALYADAYVTGGTTGTYYGLYVNRGQTYFGGNVGIGTTGPYQKLQVSGNIIANYANSIYLDYFGSPDSYKKGFSGLNQSTGVGRGLHIFNYDNDSNQGINFWVGTNASRIQAAIITSAGNVGIGTTSPQAKLDVNGTVRMPGFLSTGNSATMSLPAGATYTVLSWGTYYTCEDYVTYLRLDGANVKSYSGGGYDTPGCDQNTIMVRLTGVASGDHTWSFDRGLQWDFMWMAFRE